MVLQLKKYVFDPENGGGWRRSSSGIGYTFIKVLMPGQGSMTICTMWFFILQVTSLDRIWSKVNLFCSNFREKRILGVF